MHLAPSSPQDADLKRDLYQSRIGEKMAVMARREEAEREAQAEKAAMEQLPSAFGTMGGNNATTKVRSLPYRLTCRLPRQPISPNPESIASHCIARYYITPELINSNCTVRIASHCFATHRITTRCFTSHRVASLPVASYPNRIAS